MRRIGIIALIGSVGMVADAKADQVDDLAGRWHGNELAVLSGAEEVPEEVRLIVEGSSRGFTVTLDLGDEGFDSISFEPTTKDGVYAVAESGGLLSLFRGETSADPLEGEPLIWARTTEQGIAIYRLQISRNGHFELVDFRGELEGDAVKLRYLERSSGAEPRLVEAILTQEG